MVLAHNINEGIRTQDVQISEDVTFDTMLLTPNTLEGLTNCGFYKPSPIQLHGIPLGKCGFDLILEAKSGTGKTAVFTVIALEKLDFEKGLQTVIMAPTREIAAQICDVITQIGSNYKKLTVEVVIGGLPVNEDVSKFKKKVHIVVGSPGRLRHLIQENCIDVSAVRLLVLDEADKLMDRTFQADINYIFSVLPKEKQVIMSSATYPAILKTVMSKYLQNAQHICPDSTTVLLGIKQSVITVKSNSNIVRQTQNRFEELLKILSKQNFKQCLIFCNYQARVRDLCKMLLREKWPAEKLHGQQEQTDRLDALKMLQEYKCRILISTDLAARGIDASNIDLVVNFEPAYDWQTYLHRIGRAGRFGSYGIAVTILSEGQEESKFKKMIKSINGLLVLKNFWDDEKFDVDECDCVPDSLIYQDIENNDAYNEILNKLTDGDSKYVEPTESFETLCNSFEKIKESEIESFNDLLKCFKSHKAENYDPSYSNFSAESNEYASTFNMQTVQRVVLQKLDANNEMEDILKSEKDKIELTSDRQIPRNIVKEVSKTDEEHETHLESHNKFTMNVAHELKQEINIDDGLCGLEFDESLVNKQLLDAGLPTSFQSINKSRKIYSTYSNDNENKQNSQKSNNIKYKKTGNKNKPQKERKAYNKLESKKCFSGWETDSSNREINLKETINGKTNPRKLIKDEKKKNYNYNNHGRRDSQIYDHEVEINCDMQMRYMIWYNQLKTHIKQVQMSLYIEELSKM